MDPRSFGLVAQQLARDAARDLARDVGRALLRALVVGALVLLAFGPLARAVGATETHACACGMKPGTCGCPECARLLHADDVGRGPTTVAVLGACDDHGRPAPLAAPLPPALLPAGIVVDASPRAGVVVSLPRSPWVPSAPDGPPTPPPRFASV